MNIPHFRAIHNDTQRVHDVLVIDWLNNLIDLSGGVIEVPFEKVTLQQQTPYCAANGTTLYEGDYVSGRNKRSGTQRGGRISRSVSGYTVGSTLMEDYMHYNEHIRIVEKDTL